MAGQSDDEKAADILTHQETAARDRTTWDTQFEEIARRVLPSYSNSFTGNGMGITDGSPKTEEMVDATAALALPKFAAAMESMLTPRGQTWHRLAAIDKSLMKNRAVQLYFEEVNAALFRYRYAPRANYASQQHEIYMGLGAFGTGAMFIDALQPPYEKGLRYRTIHLGEIWFRENFQGIIDTAFRKFQLTPRQAYQQFGDALPEKIKDERDKPEQQSAKHWFVHVVRPRGDGYDPNRLDIKGMRFESCYVSVTGKKLVKEGGFNVFPYAISRYVVAPGEIYGRSPAMLALPAIKVLNEQQRTVLKQGHRAVDPVLLAADDGVIDSFSMKPGAINAGGVNAQGQPLVHALPVGNLSLAKEMMSDGRSVINDAFLITLFQILVEQPQMTATEVLERAREKGAMLSPTMGRQQSEALGPMIEREIDVLAAQRLLPEMPIILQQFGAEYEASYDSPLSRSQRAENGTGLMNLVNWLKEVVAITQDPAPLDYINWDVATPALADLQAVPAAWIADQATVQQIRAGRAKQAMMSQMIDAAPAVAGAAKAMPGLAGAAGAA